MKVHEIMTAHARCVGPDNNLVEAAGLMRELDIGAVPVCDNDHLAGMVTDRDLAVRAVADGRDPNETLVRDVMSPGIVYVFADQEVEEAVRIMEQKQVRRLPVLNRGKRLVGIVALGDIATTSHPAFSGIALREVSESERTLAHRAAKEPAVRMPRGGARMQPRAPRVPGESRRGGTRTRGGASRGPAKTRGGRAAATGGGRTRARAKTQGGARKRSSGGGNRRGGRRRATRTSRSGAGARG